MPNRYPSIEELAVIGDRRTAALLDSRGTIQWVCLPWYNSDPLLAGLLDADRGGSWRIGIRDGRPVRRTYQPRSPIHELALEAEDGTVEVLDFMPFPQADRPSKFDGSRLLVRLIRCTRGHVELQTHLKPRQGVDVRSHGPLLVDLERGDDRIATLHSSAPMCVRDDAVEASHGLGEGDVAWFVLEGGDGQFAIDPAEPEQWLQDTRAYWADWCAGLTGIEHDRNTVADAACLVHLLTCAPAGATVAAPTTSLPERIGGDRNYDYRYSWIRDASISLAMLAMLGRTECAREYMEWICGLESATAAPLQVVYQFNGGTHISERVVDDLSGYENSAPVRFGNRAHGQLQLDSLGFFADCALEFLDAGGTWDDRYWRLLHQAADFTCSAWRQPDSGVWELPANRQWTSSKAMSWVVLDRSITLADRLEVDAPRERWAVARDEIHAAVLEHGWDDAAGSFRQRLDGGSVDGSLLLLPLMRFLPAGDPRVRATVARIRAELEVDGLVFRFDPRTTPGSEGELPLGEYEGAFLACSCWLATALAMDDQRDAAEQLLQGLRDRAPLGLFAEQVDVRSGRFLGNSPLLLSHAEYVRARLAIELASER